MKSVCEKLLTHSRQTREMKRFCFFLNNKFLLLKTRQMMLNNYIRYEPLTMN